MAEELVNYIITHYVGLFNEKEYKAYRHINSLEKLGPVTEIDNRLSAYKKMEWISSDPEVLKLIEDGSDIFFQNTAERIMTDSPNEVFINNCSDCGKLARTPKAKQCRYCGNKWYE